jgi:hypothetical protein
MILKDVKIMAVNRGRYKEISIRFQVKPEDYTMEEYEQLHDQAIDGTCGVLVWQPFEEKQEPETKDKYINMRPKFTDYAKFKLDVERDFGVEAYKKIKTNLGVAHLKDLELRHDIAEIGAILSDELYNLRLQSGFYDQI